MDDRNGFDKLVGQFNGKTGVVTSIDKRGYIGGTWDGVTVIEGVDEYEVITA